MKKFEIKDKEYIYLLKYFDGDITNLNLEDLKSLKFVRLKKISLTQKSKLLKMIIDF